MKKLNLRDASRYVEEHIGEFHERRVESLDKLKLKVILAKKNPYLFKAKYMQTADQIVKVLTDAHISSNEETIFGKLAGRVCHFYQQLRLRWEKVWNFRH